MPNIHVIRLMEFLTFLYGSCLKLNLALYTNMIIHIIFVYIHCMFFTIVKATSSIEKICILYLKNRFCLTIQCIWRNKNSQAPAIYTRYKSVWKCKWEHQIYIKILAYVQNNVSLCHSLFMWCLITDYQDYIL